MKIFFSLSLLIGCQMMTAQCIKGDCDTGHGTYIFKDGSKYIGFFENGNILGKGIFYYHNGDKYLGNWKKNKKHGRGKLIFHTGEVYVGEFARDQFHGQGRFEYVDGRIFHGRWSNNNPVGDGVMIQEDGNQECGQWLDGRWTVDKSKINVIVQREESRHTQKSSKKNCNFKKCHNEEGVFTYGDGSVYEGWFFKGQPEGQGACIYASGDKYIGEWKNHSPHGEGVMYFTTGRVYGAEWDMGHPIRELEPEQATYLMKDIMQESSEEVKVWAVVIGVSRYQHMPVLNYSDDDAYRFYAFLKSPEGGALRDEQISLLIDEDASRKNILQKMQETVFKADENDVVLVYFSGHGLQGSFLPIDFDGFNNKLAYHDLTEILSLSEARYKICFADACHSGSLMAQKGIEETISQYYSAFEEVASGTAFMLSSKAEEFSLEDGGLRQGIFSHFLIRGIKGEADQNHDKIVTIGELYKYVHFEVRRYSGNVQTPMMIGQYDKDMPVGVVR